MNRKVIDELPIGDMGRGRLERRSANSKMLCAIYYGLGSQGPTHCLQLSTVFLLLLLLLVSMLRLPMLVSVHESTVDYACEQRDRIKCTIASRYKLGGILYRIRCTDSAIAML